MKRTIRILLVDDSESVREDLRILLGLLECVVVVGEAATGAQAVELSKTLAPDIVILDLELGGEEPSFDTSGDYRLEGCSVAHVIKSTLSRCKVLILTVHGYQEAQQAAINAGADMFFVKGRDTQELLLAVQKITERNTLKKEREKKWKPI